MNVPSVSTASSAAQNAAQEAQETLGVTKQEAAKGDHQAIQKLARQAALQTAQAPQTPAVPSGGKPMLETSA